MVLTVDLTRGSMDLWNRNRDQAVDKPGRHGIFEDVITEGASAGFELLQKDIVRDWGEAEVDIGLIVMRRKESSTAPWRRVSRALRRTGR
jgi:hypothetical protein